jgi:hypothetical protein
LAKVNVPIPKKCKLGSKTVDCVFLGYAQWSIAYRFLIVKSEVSDMHVDTIMESRDTTSFENMFPMKDMHSISSFSTEIAPESIAPVESSKQPVENEEILQKDDSEAPRRSKKQRVAKSFGDGFTVYLVDDWKEVVHNKMDSILSNGPWELTEQLYGCKPVGCKWMFKKKLRPDGTIKKYKAQLVAIGYT